MPRAEVRVLRAAIVTVAASWALVAGAQTPASAVRAGVDIRSMAPSPATANEAAAPASGLTRDQRKEAALQARQTATLKPAGEAAEYRDGAAPRRPAPVAPASPAMAAAPAAVATPAPAPAPPARVARAPTSAKSTAVKKPRIRHAAAAASAAR